MDYKVLTVRTVAIAVGYFLMTLLGQVFVIGETNVSPFWPAAGYALGMVILIQQRALPGIFLGALFAAVESYNRTGIEGWQTLLLSSSIIASANTLQAWGGERILKIAPGPKKIVASLRRSFIFILWCPVIALISSLSGLIALNLFSNYVWADFPTLWLIWWGADLTGLAVMTPVMLLVASQRYLVMRGRFLFLAVLMTLITATVSAVILVSLYRNYLLAQEQRLSQLVQSQAESFNAMAGLDGVDSVDGSSDGRQAAMLSHIGTVYENLPEFGQTGEFMLGRLVNGDSIEVLLSQNQVSRGENSGVEPAGLSDPLKRAISGERGVVQVEDYRGQEILAAFAPVRELDMGLIMKTDLAEINGPFFSTSLISGATAIVLILAGVLIFRRVSAPILVSLERKVEEQERLVRERTREIERARKDIADQLAFQQVLLETIPNPVFYLGPDARYLGVNNAYEKLFGASKDDCIGETVLNMERIPEVEREFSFAEDQDVIRNGRFVRREVTVEVPGGGTHDLIFSKVRFRRQDGSPGGLLGTYVDITEQKEIARQLEIARDAAEEATRLKANFLASMSHEIRTPMNGIVGMVELLLQAEENPENRQLLKTIAISADTLLTIINDILDFSKIEAGKLELESIPFRMREVVEEVAMSLQQLASHKDLYLVTRIDPAIPEQVTGDPVRVRQIIMNLASNAIKFTESGSVVMKAELVGSDDNRTNVRLSVRDTGIGIDPEMCESLFDAFTQAESATTRKFGGTGLGLSICKHLVEMMGGTIDVESSPGIGSEFSAVMPLAPIGGEQDEEKTRELEGLTVLILSDLHDELEACRGYLQQYHVDVETLPPPETLSDLPESILALDRNPDVVVLGRMSGVATQGEAMKSLETAPGLERCTWVQLVPGVFHDRTRMASDRRVVIDVCPMKKATLLNAVAVAVGRRSPEVEEESVRVPLKKTTVLTVEEAREAGTLVLVAEDNPTNQDVIQRQLNMLGYTCEIVDNGKQALDAWSDCGPYAMLLTDCHMPVMDGFDLTRNIRELEQASAHHIPIAAITANAMQGEAEKCIAAGMDDFLSKPLKIDQLDAILKKWMPADRPDASGDARPQQSSLRQTGGETPNGKVHSQVESPVDSSVLKNMFGDDDETFREILADFIPAAESIIAEVRAGVEAGSADAIMRAAHKLKSGARSVGALRMADLSELLEQKGKRNFLEGVEGMFRELESEFTDVRDYVEKLEETGI